MSLIIQVCKPEVQTPVDIDVDSLRDAIEDIFPLVTEKAIIQWNRIPVLFDYKYDLSVTIDDLMQFLSELNDLNKGTCKMIWCSDTFNAEWVVNKNEDELIIDSEWYNVVGNYEYILNERSRMLIQYPLFIQEWKLLLKKVTDSIQQSAVCIKDKKSMNILNKLEKSIPTMGHLYGGS